MKRFKLVNGDILNYRVGNGAAFTIFLREEPAANFQRLRKSQLYAKRRGEIRDSILLTGTILSLRRGLRDGVNNLTLSTPTRRWDCRYQLSLEANNLIALYSLDTRDIHKHFREGRGRRSLIWPVDRTVPRH